MEHLESKARPGDEAGYSLIELMVVLLIIGILLSIAIPTYFNAKSGAEDRTVQYNIQSALTSEIIYYHNNGQFCLAGCSSFSNLGVPLSSASLGSVPSPSNSAIVYVEGQNPPSSSTYLCLLGESGTGNQFGIYEVAPGGSATTTTTYYARSTSLSCPKSSASLPNATWTMSESSWN